MPPIDTKPSKSIRDESRAKSASLTPQRKHRKLLKDGSGAEVWPEHVESLFVQGLRQYWQSPYAVFSRGRSRWRNQYLVDYLKTQGIVRSKKQVASHLQVLRNMWKGEPEFHLVAGADEFYSQGDGSDEAVPSTDHLTPTNSDNLSTNVPSIKPELSDAIVLDFDDSDHSSCSASPLFSDRLSDFPSSPSSVNTMIYPSFTPDTPATSPLPAASPAPFSDLHLLIPSANPVTGSSSASTSSAKNEFPPHSQFGKVRTTSGPLHSPSVAPRRRDSIIRVTKLELAAEFMPIYPIDVDTLMPSSSLPVRLNVALGIPRMDDARSPATLHGFSAKVGLSRVWTSSGRCTTKTVVGGCLTSEDTRPLEISNIELGIANIVLPDSDLTRARWLDANIPTVITQEIQVDGNTLLQVVYNLDRSPLYGIPYGLLSNQPLSNSPYSSQTMQPHYPSSHSSPLSSHHVYQQTSLSSALTPYPYYPS